MKYFFILGNNPVLSIAEISAVFGENRSFSLFGGVLIMESNEEIDAQKIIKKLGGTIKIGIINGELENSNSEELLNKVVSLIDTEKISGKFKFGISCYGKNKFNIKPLGMEIKKCLKEKGASCRWVTSREPTLSSVVVEQNKLTDKGIEIVLINPPTPLSKGGTESLLVKGVDKTPLQRGGEGGYLIGHTLAVQPFKELSFRDYGRPARDDRSGMLPPKLAQIMINLACTGTPRLKVGAFLLLDPFCGSGTILTEAMLMGYKNLIGSDISAKAIEDTKKNIEWIIKNYQLPIQSTRDYKLHNCGATELSKFLKPNSIGAIITEPYLGPQRGKIDFKKITIELENLYSKSLAEFKKVLKPNGRIVMIFPVFQTSRGSQTLSPNLNSFKIINPIPENLRDNKCIKLTNRNTIIYGRVGQKVWREIVILEK
jgi:tRNA G10  N-methylase Trm11